MDSSLCEQVRSSSCPLAAHCKESWRSFVRTVQGRAASPSHLPALSFLSPESHCCIDCPGARSAAKSAAFGGVLLAMIEGLGILLTRATAPPPAPPMMEMAPGGAPLPQPGG